MRPLYTLFMCAVVAACGCVSVSSRDPSSYGGTPVAPGHPVTKILIRLKKPNAGFCSGFLIRPTVAMTARHCFLKASSGALGAAVYFSDSNVAFASVKEAVEPPSMPGEEGVRRFVSKHTPDFVMLKLDRSPRLNGEFPNVKIINPASIEELFSAGFGRGNRSSFVSEEIRAEFIPFKTPEERRTFLERYLNDVQASRIPEVVADYQMLKKAFENDVAIEKFYSVARPRDVKATLCRGDSGGPSYVLLADGSIGLVGVNSFVLASPSGNPKCLFADYYFQTEIYLYREWIETQVREFEAR